MRKNLLGLLAALSISYLSCDQNKISLYSFYTPSHEVLLNNYFLPSLKRTNQVDNFDINVVKIDKQECQTATFYSQNWYKAVANKADLIINAIKKKLGKLLCICRY